MRKTLVLAAALAAFAAPAGAADYALDAAHTTVAFKIRHLVTKVQGRFTKFSGTFSYDPKDASGWRAEASIDPASINTDNEKRDAHLKGPDFFDAEKCPGMSFKSTKVVPIEGGYAKLSGDLTMRCVTKPVTLDLQIGGLSKDPWGVQHAGFSAHGIINRKDWGISWNKTLDGGGVFLGEMVEIDIDVDGVLKAATEKK